MLKESLDYRVRRRAELKSHLGMSHIAAHVAAVERSQRNQNDAAHLHLRVIAGRHSCGDIHGLAGIRNPEGN
jgi:hypothetical protein